MVGQGGVESPEQMSFLPSGVKVPLPPARQHVPIASRLPQVVAPTLTSHLLEEKSAPGPVSSDGGARMLSTGHCTGLATSQKRSFFCSHILTRLHFLFFILIF